MHVTRIGSNNQDVLMLRGQNIQLEGEEGKQLTEAMKRYSEATRF